VNCRSYTINSKLDYLLCEKYDICMECLDKIPLIIVEALRDEIYPYWQKINRHKRN